MTRCEACQCEAPCVSVLGLSEAGWTATQTGWKCRDCCNFEAMHKGRDAVQALIDLKVADENKRRIYYQDIVYAVCRELERAFAMRIHRGEGVVCGTVESPTTQVQDLMKELVDRDSERAKKEAASDPGYTPAEKIILGIGRRCPNCNSLMIHTRLAGYRCNRGCQ